ncbi:uncharacterized protein DSM5745_08492 [Aspergillus mulundensis]|uniref:Mcm2 3 5 family protein n=1 Tax=Aspergillus mulundensis TaxID=1810919 RepID=A0A3D8R3U8_9EURO|nr:Uncharacterized protein DSM5745_08492 [Aspergillus mulundensis]RDW68732.1 Uncharacterized protein DSM5745_08492 [Aspergillus mulundensis]
MAPAGDEYRLPPLPEFVSTWNPFDLSDRSNIRYEHAPNAEADAEASPQPVGLGITQPNSHRHSRSVSFDTTQTPDGASSRFANSETELLGENAHRHSHPHSPHIVRCPTNKTIVHRRLSWVPATILVLAVYSTLLSGFYLVLAFVKPRYGSFIGVDGNLSASTASLLSTLFAKTIELAYVTVCVSFLGQVLTRRAITKGSRGISISDMSMRTWIMQPGSLIVHWESLRYSGWTILGAITLTATLVAMLYTTAAEALVTPKLKWGSVEERVIVGDVWASFANTEYLTENCETPVAVAADPVYRNTTCLNMQHAGQAYSNYQSFIKEWARIAEGLQATPTDPATRPNPTASVYDNTTVEGRWIDRVNMADLSEKYGRIVHNVTAAMPHGGVIAAANHPDNKIIQPEDQSGEGMYELEASVPSPAVNVLCAGMNETELAPIVYTLWPNHGPFNPVNWTTNVPADVPNSADWHNRTVVDDLFGFGPDYVKEGQYAPIFGTLPKPYNTIMNVTSSYSNGAIFLLGASPDTTEPAYESPYFLCRLKAKQSIKCSTRYNATASGSHLYTVCEENRPLQYNLRVPDAVESWANDWMYIASEWSFTLSLNAGITDGAAANARLLMQFAPKTRDLDPKLPTISEALAVLAGNTLLMSSTNAPYVPFWNHTDTNILATPDKQHINATLRAIEYASGGTQKWQGIFYPILLFAFFTSALCLAFMIVEIRGKQITDFTEPQNLFALAMNSPATERLQGACGSGPAGRQLGERWFVAMEEEDEHYYIRTKAEAEAEREGMPKVVRAVALTEIDVDDADGSPALKTGRPGDSPAMREYRKLASRKSWLSGFY